ncbi:MogA/MoaB family molybdenum cofactor biosynthesis protein [Scopulibacillus cellulosilyticus]|uniref:Molybdenum cofactor biosynthesis protein B n=1 Tax=Scopulibacillus cellulosilyticus TaxID=2665665 RepID=A0ABW2PZC8_9BACL
MSVDEHKSHKPDQLSCGVITVSDTRDVDTDKSGRLIINQLKGQDYNIESYVIVKDEEVEIELSINEILSQSVDALLINGGTGIAERDVTIEVVNKLINKELPGFGEIFRMLSYTEDIGSAAILSRATAGIIGKTAVFSMPGSSGAVKLAMEKLIIPELPHIIHELNK